MLIKVLAGLAVLVIVLVMVVAMQPAQYSISRTATIAAPPTAVFAEVNDFHRWVAWSPWERIDPAMKRDYQGAPAGSGAVYTWTGNRDVGQGRMTMTESRPNELIRIRLEFFKPMAAVSTAEFRFTPSGPNTVVTWSMNGEKNFMAKAIHLLLNMDAMIGDNFDKGLAQLKSMVESGSKS